MPSQERRAIFPTFRKICGATRYTPGTPPKGHAAFTSPTPSNTTSTMSRTAITQPMGEIARTIGEVLPGARLRLGPPKGEEAEYRPVSMERMKEEFGFVPLNIRQGIEAQVAFLKDGLD